MRTSLSKDTFLVKFFTKIRSVFPDIWYKPNCGKCPNVEGSRCTCGWLPVPKFNGCLSFLSKETPVPLITGRATAGIAFVQQAILRFFAPQGRHDSRISVKFGTAVPSAVPNFTLIREYLGFRPKEREKLPKFSTFSPRRGEHLARCRRNP